MFRLNYFAPARRFRSSLDVELPSQRKELSVATWATRLDELRIRAEHEDSRNFAASAEVREGHWFGSIQSRRDRGRDRLLGRVNYSGPRGFFHGQYQQTVASNGNPGPKKAGRFSLNTALVYADGQFAISRPVTNSFMILRPNPRFRKSRIRYSSLAESDRLGPAVAATLQPLHRNTIRVLESELPVGSWIAQRTRSVVPLDGTGYLVTVGKGGGLLVEGVLTDPQGRGLSLRTGQMLSLQHPELPAFTVFTNRDGEFTLVDVEPGRYRIEMAGTNRPQVEFEVPEDVDEFFDAGQLVVEPREPSP